MNKNMTLFKVYLLAGTFTFSGGMAMLPVIERELCDKLNLITKKDLYEYTTALLSQKTYLRAVISSTLQRLYNL